ncbi:MAG: hypothetical protein AB7O88_27155 [Reyranellaceae bacterium]
MRIRLVAAALAVSLLSPPVMAQDKVGVAACDEYLENYYACLPKMTPAEQQDATARLPRWRAQWKELAADAKNRDDLAGICKSEADAMRRGYTAIGCKF